MTHVLQSSAQVFFPRYDLDEHESNYTRDLAAKKIIPAPSMVYTGMSSFM